MIVILLKELSELQRTGHTPARAVTNFVAGLFFVCTVGQAPDELIAPPS
jgi:hypothetical protein